MWGRIEELTSTTATIDLAATAHSLKLGQAVRARLGTSSTTTIVTEAQPLRTTSFCEPSCSQYGANRFTNLNGGTRYVLQFVNTTPAFRAAVRDTISALTATPDTPSLKAA